jgi:DNA-binding transcriptional LysR family regulator
VTLSQLRTFALVVRLGSLRAAAEALGVSEPAVSAAVAALRHDVGDPLFVRSGSGITFTAGGRRLAAHAEEIVGLAEQARREISETANARYSLRVVATADFAEHAVDALLGAFTRRQPGSEVELAIATGEELADSLARRVADVALGPRPAVSGAAALEAIPFLRYQRLLVAAKGHPLAEGPVSAAAMLGQPWFTGPAGVEELGEEGRWLSRQPRWPDLVRLPSETEALEAVKAGDGVMLALGHVIRGGLRDGSLVRLAVPGTPVHGLWFATTLGHGRAAATAKALQQFATTPNATAAMVAPAGTTAPPRRRSAVHITLWS